MAAQFERFKDRGYMAVTMLIEGGEQRFSGIPPTQEWLDRWAQKHNANHPILGDHDWTINQQFWGPATYPVPRTMLLKPGMEIVWKGSSIPSDRMIESHLP